MNEVDLENLVRRSWRRSELRQRLYRDLTISGDDYLEEILVEVALLGFQSHKLELWLNPFRIKASIDQVFNPPDDPQHPTPSVK